MNRLRQYRVLPLFLILLTGTVLGVQLDAYRSGTDALEQFEKMRRAFVLISGKYVEAIPAETLAEKGIDGMLSTLDPHSRYIPSEQVKRTREQYQGSFGGVGLRLEILDDTARVVAPVSHGPSEEAGVMAGDRIIQINNTPATDLSENDLKSRLRGRIGTNVTFTVYRPLSDKRLTFTITRDKIPLSSIHTSYMVDSQTGYVEVDRFAMSTHKEFKQKVNALREEGMTRLLLDLRNNPGGVMQSAIKIADEMLTADMTILRTKGRSPQLNVEYAAENGGIFENQPVIVLVNGNSASASEILSGALQDHDRALIVGQRTYGKALIQKDFPLNDESLVHITVGRYYTPAGRLIQTPYEKGERKKYYTEKSANWHDAVYNPRAYKDSIPDSLTYQTSHGRTVYGGGGILPDVVVPPDTSSLFSFIRRRQVDAHFASHWFSKHEQEFRSKWQDREDEFLSSYTLSEKALDSFWNYLEEENILTLTSNSDEVAPDDRVFSRTQAQKLHASIRTRLKGQLANELYGSGTGKPLLNQTDPTFQKAASLWPSSQELASHHASSAQMQK